MTPPNNPAARLAAVLEATNPYASRGTTATFTVWAQVFGIEENPSGPRAVLEVTRKLGLLMDQLDATKAALAATRLRPDSYYQQIAAIERALNPQLLWSQFDQAVAKHLLHKEALHYLSYTVVDLLEPDEVPLEPGSLKALLESLVEAQRLAREATDIPSELRLFALSMLDAAYTGIRDYELQGAAALKFAYRTLTTGIAERVESLRDWYKHPVIRAVIVAGAGLYGAVHATGTFVEDVGNIASAVEIVAKQVPAAQRKFGLKPAEEPKLLTPGDPPVPTP